MDLDKTLDKYHPYLAEIRKRLLFIFSLFILASFLGFIYYERIVKLTLSLFNFEGVNIVFTSPFQFVELAINSALIAGAAVIFPLLIFQTLQFIKPALRKNEYKAILSLVPISLILFLMGFAFGLTIMRYVVSLFYERSVCSI